ncbi:MAG TPA: GNAT family N-acetyltransferase, partial [Acidimicrobiia bacterium]
MIRAYTSRDTDDLVDVWYRASLVAHPFLSESFLEEERSEIVQRWLPNAETAVYEVDGRVVGFISLVGNEVGGIFVDPARQGQGIGRALMDHARRSRT